MAKEPRPFSKRAEQTIAEFRRIHPNVPAKMQRRETRELSELMEVLRVEHRIGRLAPEDAVREAWPAVVGPANASYSYPQRVEGRKLMVVATHSVVRNELFLARHEILERVRKLPGCEAVTELHLKAG
jgi:hypothetical protein